MPLLSRLEKQWDAFQAVSCVQTAFDDGFPDYSWPCTKGGKYEKSVKCMLSDDVTKLFGPSAPGMKKAVGAHAAAEGDDEQRRAHDGHDDLDARKDGARLVDGAQHVRIVHVVVSADGVDIQRQPCQHHQQAQKPQRQIHHKQG
uniref:Uncharacterized protein n=1 Tax=Rhipicephalus zambeziensis TaxID=60191 RepID=A0A224YJN4_9ACAR